MEYERNMRHSSTLGRTLVRVGVLVGLVTSVIMIARLITGRNNRLR